MQQCGITTEGVMYFQHVLKFNTTIAVVDLRLNPLIGKSYRLLMQLCIMFNSFRVGLLGKQSIGKYHYHTANFMYK